MKKKQLVAVVTVIVALLLAVPAICAAAAGSTPAAESFSSPEAAARAVGDDGVLIEVLHARVCRDVRHGEHCRVQEISGRVIASGKSVRAFRPGDCVGFRGELVPCGSCAACRAGRPAECSDNSGVCDTACRLHDGNCRNRLVTQECNLVRFSGCETAAGQYSLLCASAAPCPRLRCHEAVTADSTAVGGRHCRGRGHGRHCR